ncbi:hypothetical protein CHS0354_042571 [Potamilus streckersoni]|uniref:Uncharacterized protein n=1 Tax=Potamilus streckersoni TaxID=2493646 RepID=A0AAE0WCK3_9BIVA|nr:hypothetical protein CHS0354_042571 [Potamilus streckersoni]
MSNGSVGKGTDNMVLLALAATLILFVLTVYILSINAATLDTPETSTPKNFTTDTYNKYIRPIRNQADAFNVSVDHYLTAIIQGISQRLIVKLQKEQSTNQLVVERLLAG